MYFPLIIVLYACVEIWKMVMYGHLSPESCCLQAELPQLP